MRSVRLSLLNIVAACVLIWMGFGLLDKTLAWSTALYALVLVILLLLIDQFFRMMLGSLKRIWLVETIFIVLSVLSIWIVRYIF